MCGIAGIVYGGGPWEAALATVNGEIDNFSALSGIKES
jgi:hypothetical protein